MWAILSVALIAVFAAAGCGGSGEDGHNSLVRIDVVAPGAQCEDGGAAVHSGVDANGDGLLQPEEVSDTSYVCDGAPGADGQAGLSALVRQEDAGALDCAFGGRLVLTGLDLDGDGYLDEDEVQSTAYVCHGAALVMRASHAAWGGVCARGGVKLETGVDDDGDGVLDDPEVDQVQYVCNLFLVGISAGSASCCARLTDGTARCWGHNFWGQLGDGTTVQRLTPVAVSGLTGAAAISTGTYHSCARQTDGAARCWGRNPDGQLGDGTVTDRLTPVAVSGLSGVAELSAGSEFNCARQTDGTTWCWGDNEFGQLGDGTTTDRLVATPLAGDLAP